MNLFDLNTSHIGRNGATISLWHDKWITNLTLHYLFTGPLPKDKHLKIVASIISYNSGNPVWNPNSIPFPISPLLAKKIHNITHPLSPDSIKWNLSANRVFTIKSAYNSLTKTPTRFVILWIWQSICIIREKYFFYGKHITLEYLHQNIFLNEKS